MNIEGLPEKIIDEEDNEVLNKVSTKTEEEKENKISTPKSRKKENEEFKKIYEEFKKNISKAFGGKNKKN